MNKKIKTRIINRITHLCQHPDYKVRMKELSLLIKKIDLGYFDK